MMEIIPNWHPVFVHFTVGLLAVATILHVAFMVVQGEPLKVQLKTVARWNLWLGAAFTVITVITGVLAYNSVQHDDPSHLAMTDHRNWAIVTAAVFLLIALWSAFRVRGGKQENALLVLLLVVASVLLGSTAWRGGEIVYRYGLGVMSLPKVDMHGHDATDAHGHDEGSADGHHNDADSMMQDNEVHGHDQAVDQADDHHNDSMEQGELHTHADGTVEQH